MTHTRGKSREEDEQTGVGRENTVIMRRTGDRNTHTNTHTRTHTHTRFKSHLRKFMFRCQRFTQEIYTRVHGKHPVLAYALPHTHTYSQKSQQSDPLNSSLKRDAQTCDLVRLPAHTFTYVHRERRWCNVSSDVSHDTAVKDSCNWASKAQHTHTLEHRRSPGLKHTQLLTSITMHQLLLAA